MQEDFQNYPIFVNYDNALCIQYYVNFRMRKKDVAPVWGPQNARYSDIQNGYRKM